MVVIQGDLTAARTDVIVNAANEQPAHEGGVAVALAAAGGEAFRGGLLIGGSLSTPAGCLRSGWWATTTGPPTHSGPAWRRWLAAAGELDAYQLSA